MVGTQMALGPKPQENQALLERRGEGVEPSGERNARQAGFEDRWGHRAPSSSILYFSSAYANSIVRPPIPVPTFCPLFRCFS